MNRFVPVDLGAPDPYEVLGIAPTAGGEEIKQAYFAQVRAHSPERDPTGFKLVRAAYDRLKTPDLKLDTDMLRFQTWTEPLLSDPEPLDMKVDPIDIIVVARACSDLARTDWREDWREVKL